MIVNRYLNKESLENPRDRDIHNYVRTGFTMMSGQTNGFVGKSKRAESCIFSTQTANFRQRQLWELKILILLLNVPQNVIFSPIFCSFLNDCFLTKTTIF